MKSDLVPQIPSVTQETYGSIADWQNVNDRIFALAQLKHDWDGEGAPAICPEKIRSALDLATHLMAKNSFALQDIYPLPDGNIILEWRFQDGVIERIEIEEVGQGEVMITYPDHLPGFSRRPGRQGYQLPWFPHQCQAIPAASQVPLPEAMSLKSENPILSRFTLMLLFL